MLHFNIVWYERKPDWSPDYDKQHSCIITGKTPAECMETYRLMGNNHDVVKYTILRIVDVYE